MSAKRPPLSPAEFDSFGRDYDASLAEGLSVSGEDKDFFARGRVQWLSFCLRKAGVNPEKSSISGVASVPLSTCCWG